MNEYRVKVTVRNNLILAAIEARGYVGWGSMGRFCDDYEIEQSRLASLVAMRESPINAGGVVSKGSGAFSVTAQRLMEALGAAPSDLWTDEQLYAKLARNTAETTMGAEDFKALLQHQQNARLEVKSPEEVADVASVSKLVHEVLAGLTPRRRKVLALRFGHDMTLEETATALGVTRERVRQIENEALRALRHPDNADRLRAAL